jgi:hypothetical protein
MSILLRVNLLTHFEYEPGYLVMLVGNRGTNYESYSTKYAQNITSDKLPDWLPALFREILQTPGRSERMVERALERIIVAQHSAQLCDEAMTELANPDYTEPAVAAILRAHAPNYVQAGSLIFEVFRYGDVLFVHTNINYGAVSKSNGFQPTGNSSVDPSGNASLTLPGGNPTSSTDCLLNLLLDVKGDLHYAAKLGAEIASDLTNARLIQLRLSQG